MSEDGTLLREYVESGSDAAFAHLVQRHLDLVYSTALRSVGGDAHLAKDVSQSVFIDLARKAASLSKRADLTGWLYTSTCFAAAKVVRSERRRHNREQEAHAMQEHVTSSPDYSNWDQIAPVLNTVMLELKEADREVLLLRFFQRRPLAEVGHQLGLTENAARPDAVRQNYGSVDGVILDWMLSHATPMASFRVMSQADQGPDDVSLVEQHQYTDDRVRENTVQFHRDETGAWRQVLPPEMMPKLEIVMNQLAGTPASAGGK
jgi:RNA polymerase sigma factor (sigma-70 family)